MAPSRDCRRSCIWPCAPPVVWQLQDLICCSMRSLFLCHSPLGQSPSLRCGYPCSVWGHRSGSLSFLGRTRAAHVRLAHQTCQTAVLPASSEDATRTQKLTVWNQKLAETARIESTESTDMVGESGFEPPTPCPLKL